jgi:DNA-3-methyladenine glycosylase I
MVEARKSCFGGDDELMLAYHDLEWGVPVHDDRILYEFLVLSGFQAGLSWKTILYKRAAFQKAMHGFDPNKIARYGEREMATLLDNAAILRNKQKLTAAIKNAKAVLKTQEEFGSFDHYIWQFTDYKTIVNKRRTIADLPSSTRHSEKMSKDLVARGFSFAGPTICYAFMQTVGMVNDHLVSCFRHTEVGR